MVYQDQTIKCRDCSKEFIFTVRDQEFFAQRGFTNAPTRCRDCRDKRKKTVEAAGNKVLYKIACKACGKSGEMATEPRKPEDVLCSECFYEAFRAKAGEEPKETTEEVATTEAES